MCPNIGLESSDHIAIASNFKVGFSPECLRMFVMNVASKTGWIHIRFWHNDCKIVQNKWYVYKSHNVNVNHNMKYIIQ